MKHLLDYSLSMLCPITLNVFKNIPFESLTQFITTSGHFPLKFLVCVLIHISYFHALRFLFPTLRNDRKRISWVLTWVSTSILGAASLLAMYTSCRTIFQKPIPYELYNSMDPATGVFYHRFDVAFPVPHRLSPGIEWDSSSHWQKQDPQLRSFCLDQFSLVTVALSDKNVTMTDPCQCAQEDYRRDMLDFYRHIDATFYAPVSSTKALYPIGSWAELFGWLRLPTRLFFDMTFSPAGAVYAQWMMLFFASYLSMDLVIGTIYYKEKITLISGYLHHSLYIFICNVSLWTGYTVPCAYLYFMEIPTAFLGAGFIFPSLRDDNLFGLLFFIFRIALDPLMAHEILRNTTMTPIGKAMVLIKVPLNIKFFVDWIVRQKKLRRRALQQRPHGDVVEEKKMAQRRVASR
ncbi:hypothetical protein BGZ93_008539 [Podila epicladia]|nr:hypothetical protein BGZ92_011205 [Podila epicladia]KAG0092013.1 hypothetical protein BGZ93_008539 [Podila epicladia]